MNNIAWYLVSCKLSRKLLSKGLVSWSIEAVGQRLARNNFFEPFLCFTYFVSINLQKIANFEFQIIKKYILDRFSGLWTKSYLFLSESLLSGNFKPFILAVNFDEQSTNDGTFLPKWLWQIGCSDIVGDDNWRANAVKAWLKHFGNLWVLQQGRETAEFLVLVSQGSP